MAKNNNYLTLYSRVTTGPNNVIETMNLPDLNPAANFLISPDATNEFISVYSKESALGNKDALAIATTAANIYLTTAKVNLSKPVDQTLAEHMSVVRKAMFAVNPSNAQATVDALVAAVPTTLDQSVITFIRNPAVKGFFYLADKWRLPQIVPNARTLKTTFLALCNLESDFFLYADAPTTSAFGPLQIIRATYYAAINQIGAASLSEFGNAFHTVKRFMSSVASMSTINSGGARFSATALWAFFNREKPDLDLSAPFAYMGVMRDTVLSMNRDWVWTPTGYLPKRSTPTAQQFIKLMGSVLKTQGPGFAALAAFYHINGSNALDAKLAHVQDGRYVGDAKVFNDLSGAVGIDSVYSTIFREVDLFNRIEVGDVVVEAADVESWNASVLSLNADAIKHIKPKGAAVVTSLYNPNRLPNAAKGITHKGHFGLDLRAAVGTPVFAPFHGVITSHYNKVGTGWGVSCVLTTSKGVEYRFAHLSKILIPVMKSVKAGQIIALSGKSGTLNPHLHLEVTIPKIGRIDPQKDPDKGWTKVL